MALGYDKIPLYHQIMYDITMEEAVGAAGAYTFDRAYSPIQHQTLLHGATIAWVQVASGLTVMDLTAATPDWLDVGGVASGDFDFTSEDFAGAIWINLDALAATYLICRGLLNTDGWYFYVDANGALHVITNQAAASQDTFSSDGDVVINTWMLVGFSRSGDTVNIYKNGKDVTDTHGVHADPTATIIGRELHIGIYDDEVSGPLDGSIWRPRIWNQYLSQLYHWQMFEMERHWFGV